MQACLGGSDINSVGAKIQVFTDSFWPLDTGFGQQHGLEGTKPTPPMAAGAMWCWGPFIYATEFL